MIPLGSERQVVRATQEVVAMVGRPGLVAKRETMSDTRGKGVVDRSGQGRRTSEWRPACLVPLDTHTYTSHPHHDLTATPRELEGNGKR